VGLLVFLILAYVKGVRNIIVEKRTYQVDKYIKKQKERNFAEYYPRAKLKDLYQRI
jgi:hypothetical protein